MALQLDNSTSEMYYDAGFLLWTPSSDDVTISVWLYYDNPGTSAYAVCVGDDAATTNYEIAGADIDGYGQFNSRSASGNRLATTANTFNSSAWNHLCGYFCDPAVRSNYVYAVLNGDTANEGADTTGREQPAVDDSAIGGRYLLSSVSKTWDGYIAHLAIWTTVLDAAELAALAAGVNPMRIRPSSLKWYFPLLTNTNSHFNPSVTQPSWTANGTPTWIGSGPPVPPIFGYTKNPRIVSRVTLTATTSVTADVYNMLGWAWGQQSTSYVEIPEKWSVWRVTGGGAAPYDTVYGLLQLKSGQVAYSDVKDIGSSADRLLTIDIDKYGSGSGTQGTIEWRGSTTTFNWDAGSPSWSEYPDGGSIENWRYVQVRLTG